MNNGEVRQFQIAFNSQTSRLTQRAADGGWAARFLSSFLASSCFRFEGESTLPPTAANAPRWAAVEEKELLT